MATIEIDERVARDWLKAYQGGDCRSTPHAQARLSLRDAIVAALPPELEVGWHEVVYSSNDQCVAWWGGTGWTWDRAGNLVTGHNIRSVKYLGK